jgi:iron(III) transport system permease protein
MQTRASRAASEKVLGGGKGLIAAAAFGLVALFAMGPHLGVLLTSVTVPGQWYGTALPTHYTLDHYQQALTAGDSFGAIVTSLKFALTAMVVDIALGIVIAYLIVRTNVRGRGVLDALCMLPLAVPGLVLAFGYAAMSLQWPFAKGGPLDMFGIFTANPNPAFFLVIAYSVRRLPYMVRSTVAGLEQTSGELEEAAVNLGASRITAMRRVIVPLIMANLIAGGLLVFSFSMLEVSDSLILAQQQDDFPITKAILSFTERLGDGIYIASALGAWGMALLTVTLFGASALLGKKLGSIFRV